MTYVVNLIVELLLLVFSAMVHEVAHAWVAWRCGDPTAHDAGRISLNPTKHLDPVGSFAIPLVMLAMGGPIFAYAKPVPYNPRRLKHPVRDEVLVAMAGPASNLVQACIAAALIRSAALWSIPVDAAYQILSVLSTYLMVNVSLMLFNLIPLPPLDGSALISPLFRGEARMTYYKIQQYAMPIFIVVLYILPQFVHIDIVGTYMSVAGSWVMRVLIGA